MFDPLDYPWPTPLEPGPDVALDGRTLVLAVGSNASAAVLAHKLADVDPVVPLAECVVTGVAVGHSAHVSAGGYVPAAPFAAAGVRSTLRAGWFTAGQLAALDATEPNYERITLSAADHPLDLDQPCFDLYRSRRGVLALDGSPLGLVPQRELLALLAAAGAPSFEPAALRAWCAERGMVEPDGFTP